MITRKIKKGTLLKLTVILMVVLIGVTPVTAAADKVFENKCAQVLVKLGLMQGYEDGSLRLENNIKRSEFITLILKVACIEKSDNIDTIKMSFEDLNTNHWAYDYIMTAWHFGIISGYPDNTFAPDNPVTLTEALLALIRILGYESEMVGNWPDNVLEKASQLELCKNLDIPGNKALTRGEAAVIIFNALTVEIK